MAALHRHRLVELTGAGWRAVMERPQEDDEARACVAHWAAQRLPLVVTRQSAQALELGELDVGLSAPLQWSRRRLGLRVSRSHVERFGEFPGLEALGSSLPAAQEEALQALCASLAMLGVHPHVYGSHGWQLMTGLPCVHPRSDIDSWSLVTDAAHADAVSSLLDECSSSGLPRLDGELLFPDGRAVAWREWRAWRAGRCRALLVKTLTGASLVDSWKARMGRAEEASSC
jgi:phosphoribosyl-dephospho-CoA transferase